MWLNMKEVKKNPRCGDTVFGCDSRSGHDCKSKKECGWRIVNIWINVILEWR